MYGDRVFVFFLDLENVLHESLSEEYSYVDLKVIKELIDPLFPSLF